MLHGRGLVGTADADLAALDVDDDNVASREGAVQELERQQDQEANRRYPMQSDEVFRLATLHYPRTPAPTSRA